MQACIKGVSLNIILTSEFNVKQSTFALYYNNS